jgi:hypothetical protein
MNNQLPDAEGVKHEYSSKMVNACNGGGTLRDAYFIPLPLFKLNTNEYH